jgi:hypothetical protein
MTRIIYKYLSVRNIQKNPIIIQIFQFNCTKDLMAALYRPKVSLFVTSYDFHDENLHHPILLFESTDLHLLF